MGCLFLSSLPCFFFLCLIFDDAKRVYKQVKKKKKTATNARSKLVSRSHVLPCSPATAGPVCTVFLTPVVAIPSTFSSSPLGETVNTAVTREVRSSRTDRSWRAGRSLPELTLLVLGCRPAASRAGRTRRGAREGLLQSREKRLFLFIVIFWPPENVHFIYIL